MTDPVIAPVMTPAPVAPEPAPARAALPSRYAPRDDGQPLRNFGAAAATAGQTAPTALPSFQSLRAQPPAAPVPAPAASGPPGMPPGAGPGGGPPAPAPAFAGPLAPTPPATAVAPGSPMPAATPTITVRPNDPDRPIGLKIDDASRAAEAPSFFRQLGQAAIGGLAAPLADLNKLGDALARNPAPAQDAAPADYATPLTWSDLVHPESAVEKAVYQVARGAPVLAAGIAGGVAGGIGGTAVGGKLGGTLGTMTGGALGAGAMQTVQALGPYFAAGVHAGLPPEQAWQQAVLKAGQDGVFTAAGWALFGLNPFAGAAKNLLFQAFGVQPAAAAGERAVTNLEEDKPVTEGLADAGLSAAIGTVLPAAGHAAIRAGLGAMRGTAAEPTGAPGATPAGPLESLDPASIKTDAARFQFKAGGDEAGVTDRLAGVTKWDPRLAGTALVYRDETGQNWIADGHQRLGLAQRMAAAGQPDVKLNAFVLDAANGVTDGQARGIAAAKNIAEGTGTAIDAAKVIREAAATGTELPPLPPRSALVRDGQALAKLGDDAFGMAVNQVVPINQAAIVGRLVTDPLQQSEAIRVLAQAKPENAYQAELVVREMLASGTTMGTQDSLFGPEAFASSVVLERAKIIDEANKQLGRDRGTFRVLVNRAAEIADAGNTLDTEGNQARLTTDEQATQLLTSLGTTKGPVSDQLSGIARDLKSGAASRADAGRRFLRIVRTAIEDGVATGSDAGGAGSGDAGGRPGEVAPPAGEAPAGPGLFDAAPTVTVTAHRPGEASPAAPRNSTIADEIAAVFGPRKDGEAEAAPGTEEHPSGDWLGFNPTADDLTPRQHSPDEAGPDYGPIAEAPIRINGQPIDRLAASADIETAARRYLSGETGDNPVQVSLQHLTGRGDLDAEVTRLASFMPREPGMRDQVLQMLAYSQQMDLDHIGSLLVGRLPDAPRTVAYKMMLDAGATEVHEAARTAVESGLQSDWTKAIRATALQMRLASEWTEVGTEMGRAFRARQLQYDARGDEAAAVRNIIANVGAAEMEQVIRRIAMLDDPVKVSPFLATLRRMTGRDGLLYGYYNMLLSNPVTLVKKAISDTGMVAWNLTSRYLAETAGSDVAPGETGALLAGYIGATGDAFRAAGKAAMAGHSQFYEDHNTLDGLNPDPRETYLKDGMGPDSPTAASPTWAGWQYLRAALPTSLISAVDDFAKVMNYRAELGGLTWRKTWREGLTGQDQVDRQQELLGNIDQATHQQAFNAALRTTFQEPLTGIAASLQELADRPIIVGGVDIPFIRLLLPFIKVPANIIKAGFNMTPLPLALSNSQMRLDLAAGGARRSIALAKLGLGTSITTLGYGMVMAGNMTGGGPADPGLREARRNAEIPDYSIKLGDNWYGYRRLEPLGSLLGMIADSVEVARYAPEQDATHVAASAIFGVGNAILSATYLESVAGFLNALHAPASEGVKWITQQASSLVIPQIAPGIERAADESRRAHSGMLETMRSEIPGAAGKLPPETTMWGQPIPQKQGFFPGFSGSFLANLLSPISTQSGAGGSPIENWVWEHRNAFPQADNGKLGFYGIGRTQHFTAADGSGAGADVTLDPQQHYALKKLAGNELPLDPNVKLGLKDSLDALVRGDYPGDRDQQQWNNASDEARAQLVVRMVNDTRAGAKTALLKADPVLAEKVQAQWDQRRAQLAGPPGGAPAPAAGPGAAPVMPNLGGPRP
jgi:hypothetical protein